METLILGGKPLRISAVHSMQVQKRSGVLLRANDDGCKNYKHKYLIVSP